MARTLQAETIDSYLDHPTHRAGFLLAADAVAALSSVASGTPDLPGNTELADEPSTGIAFALRPGQGTGNCSHPRRAPF